MLQVNWLTGHLVGRDVPWDSLRRWELLLVGAAAGCLSWKRDDVASC